MSYKKSIFLLLLSILFLLSVMTFSEIVISPLKTEVQNLQQEKKGLIEDIRKGHDYKSFKNKILPKYMSLKEKGIEKGFHFLKVQDTLLAQSLKAGLIRIDIEHLHKKKEPIFKKSMLEENTLRFTLKARNDTDIYRFIKRIENAGIGLIFPTSLLLKKEKNHVNAKLIAKVYNIA